MVGGRRNYGLIDQVKNFKSQGVHSGNRYFGSEEYDEESK